MPSDWSPYFAFSATEIAPISHGPRPRPNRLLISRKVPDVPARIRDGARCCDAVMIGPNHNVLSALGISRMPQASIGEGVLKPRTNIGAAISQAIAGTQQYQARSSFPNRSDTTPPMKMPNDPPISSSAPMNSTPMTSRSEADQPNWTAMNF